MNLRLIAVEQLCISKGVLFVVTNKELNLTGIPVTCNKYLFNGSVILQSQLTFLPLTIFEAEVTPNVFIYLVKEITAGSGRNQLAPPISAYLSNNTIITLTVQS